MEFMNFTKESLQFILLFFSSGFPGPTGPFSFSFFSTLFRACRDFHSSSSPFILHPRHKCVGRNQGFDFNIDTCPGQVWTRRKSVDFDIGACPGCELNANLSTGIMIRASTGRERPSPSSGRSPELFVLVPSFFPMLLMMISVISSTFVFRNDAVDAYSLKTHRTKRLDQAEAA